MQMLLCVHVNLVVRPCKFRCVSMRMSEEKKQEKNRRFSTISEQKLLILRLMSLLKGILRLKNNNASNFRNTHQSTIKMF